MRGKCDLICLNNLVWLIFYRKSAKGISMNAEHTSASAQGEIS